MATTTRITAAEYLARPDDDRFTQLIGGELVVTAPSVRHQMVLTAIVVRVFTWTEAAAGRGMAVPGVGVRLTDHDVFVPDVVWVAEHNLPADADAVLHGPPDLAVEVRSPSTWRYDLGHKKSVYERTGVQELWLVDPPADTVVVFRRSQPEAPEFDVSLELTTGDRLTTPLLPGLALDLGELFA